MASLWECVAALEGVGAEGRGPPAAWPDPSHCSWTGPAQLILPLCSMVGLWGSAAALEGVEAGARGHPADWPDPSHFT